MPSCLSKKRINTIARIAVAGFVSGCLLAVSASGGAVAQPTPKTQADGLSALGITVSDDGWLSYTKSTSGSLGLSDVTTKVVKGSRDADGVCVNRGTVTTGSVPTYIEEIGFNPDTCESKILTGRITAATAAKLAAADGPSTTTGTTRSAQPASKGASPGLAAATSYQSAHTVTRWIDPLNILITRQAINLKWPLYGAGGTLSSSWPYYKYPYDGWAVYGPNFSGFKTLSDNSGWYVSANTHFVNYDFAALVYFLMGLSGWLACGAHLSTRADFYHNVKVTGKRNDSASYSWNDSKSGACSNLVHHSTSTGFGWY